MTLKNQENYSQNLIRLNRFIALAGICSRREADELIKKGYITVDGKVVKELGVKVPLDADVRYKGVRIFPEKPFCYKAYKPRGYKCASGNALKNKRNKNGKIFPESVTPATKIVAPLLRTTEGLLLMTNNGILIEKISRNLKTIPQVYEVTATGKVHEDQILRLKRGLVRSGIRFVPQDVFVAEKEKNRKKIVVIITHPYHRFLLRALKEVGIEYLRVKRTYFGEIALGGMEPGDVRELTRKEMLFLWNLPLKKR